MIDIKFSANTVTELKELIGTFLNDGPTTQTNEIRITAQKAEAQKAEPQEEPQAVDEAPVLPTSQEVTYKKEDLQRAAVALMEKDAGFNPTEFLSSFGASAFSDIPESRYGEFADELRKLGGEI